MRAAAFVAALTAGAAFASAHSPSSPATHKRSQAKRASSYSLSGHYAGQELLDLFDFDTHSSNGGIANYVDSSAAYEKDLVTIKDGRVHIRVSPTAEDGKLAAVKLSSKQQYSEGLYIWDIERMPQVCGAWPAIWSTGDNWPAGGEMDLVEYVSRQSMNGMSVHTTTGCWAGSSGYTGEAMMTDASQALNCDSDATDAQGCGFRTKENHTAGLGANYGMGGVYALEWATSGIKMWYFPRSEIPSDLKRKNPEPSSWKKPTLFVDEANCSPISNYFSAQTWVINTEICGTWADGVWNSDNSYAGQNEGSCASRTGYSTCAEYALAESPDFKHAYWRIGSLSVYNK
ncbi:hypothetical protein JCM10450v2_000038 [Rhodotorula kratochvilovae]